MTIHSRTRRAAPAPPILAMVSATARSETSSPGERATPKARKRRLLCRQRRTQRCWPVCSNECCVTLKYDDSFSHRIARTVPPSRARSRIRRRALRRAPSCPRPSRARSPPRARRRAANARNAPRDARRARSTPRPRARTRRRRPDAPTRARAPSQPRDVARSPRVSRSPRSPRRARAR